MDANDFSSLTSRDRVKQMKIWPIIILAAFIFGAFGIYNLFKSVDPVVANIYAKSAVLHVVKESLEEIDKEIENLREYGEVPKELIEKRQNKIQRIQELNKELDALYNEAKKQNIKIDPPDYSSILNFIVAPVFAQTTKGSEAGRNSVASFHTQQALKTLVLKIVLAIVAMVYLFVNYKVWFSSNPRNMNVAIDILKTLTGFWVGLGTSVF